MSNRLVSPFFAISLAFISLFPFQSFAQPKEMRGSISLSQSLQDKPSKELLARMTMYQKVCRLNYEQKFDSIILLSRSIPFRDSLYLYSFESIVAQAYFEKGDKANGFKYLVKAIENDDLGEIGNITYQFKKYKLDSNETYKDIIRNFDKLHDKYVGRLNGKIMKDCLDIFNTDQRIRNIWLYTDDSITKMHADFIQYCIDTMNVTQMEAIMSSIGHYPGLSDIGKTFLTNFSYIVEHFAPRLNGDRLYVYLKTATISGQIPNWYGPKILDKMAHNEKRPLLFGEYGNSDDFTADGTYIMEPIGDIEHVDRRRADFLLPPLYKMKETQKCVLPKGYDPATQK